MLPLAALIALGAAGGAGIGALKGGGRGALLGGLLGGGAGYGIPALMGMGAAGAGASATPALGPGLMEMSGAATPAGVGAATATTPATGGIGFWPAMAQASVPAGIESLLQQPPRRFADVAKVGGGGRMGALPAIYQSNPMLFKAMLSKFLRGG